MPVSAGDRETHMGFAWPAEEPVKELPSPLVPAKAGTQFSSQNALMFAKASICDGTGFPLSRE
jgi:hypothetical protein